ncbi:MAG: sulfite exporter TauE/SafE family protein [Cytophagales bacterium]|nr:MAG: sulfite exporter TauE/SafE family protein [Cytophagales bacterium]
MIGLKIILLFWLLSSILQTPHSLFDHLNEQFLLYIMVGFLAQLVDGTMGMAYGVSCNTLLLSLGVPPVIASAGVHTAEVFTTGVSGLSHLYAKNVERRLLLFLVVFGVLGAFLGVFLLANVFSGDFIKPYIALYLAGIGIFIVYKSYRPVGKEKEEISARRIGFWGFTGGLLDAIGGGGWGPVVVSNLLKNPKDPHIIIGTVNTAEFFVTLCSGMAFLFFVGFSSSPILLGLIVGGVLAAPLGALLLRYIKAAYLMRLVGILLSITSLIVIYKSLW